MSGHTCVCRRPFTLEEDAALTALVGPAPQCPWDQIAAQMPGRSARQCRERWISYLSPSLRVGPWTLAEDQQLLDEIARFGHQWTIIAHHFHGRSGNDVKNRWYSHLQSDVVLGPDGRCQIVRSVSELVFGQKWKRRGRPARPPEVAVDRVARVPLIPLSELSFGERVELPPLLPRPGCGPSCQCGQQSETA
jgi:hypothetical protein